MQNCKFKVIIGDDGDNHLDLCLMEKEFHTLDLSAFINLGLIVTVHKIIENENGKI